MFEVNGQLRVENQNEDLAKKEFELRRQKREQLELERQQEKEEKGSILKRLKKILKI